MNARPTIAHTVPAASYRPDRYPSAPARSVPPAVAVAAHAARRRHAYPGAYVPTDGIVPGTSYGIAATPCGVHDRWVAVHAGIMPPPVGPYGARCN